MSEKKFFYNTDDGRKIPINIEAIKPRTIKNFMIDDLDREGPTMTSKFVVNSNGIAVRKDYRDVASYIIIPIGYNGESNDQSILHFTQEENRLNLTVSYQYRNCGFLIYGQRFIDPNVKQIGLNSIGHNTLIRDKSFNGECLSWRKESSLYQEEFQALSIPYRSRELWYEINSLISQYEIESPQYRYATTETTFNSNGTSDNKYLTAFDRDLSLLIIETSRTVVLGPDMRRYEQDKLLAKYGDKNAEERVIKYETSPLLKDGNYPNGPRQYNPHDYETHIKHEFLTGLNIRVRRPLLSKGA